MRKYANSYRLDLHCGETYVAHKLFTHLTFHRISVNLTHVLTPILFLNIFDVEIPGAMVIVRNRNSRVVRDNVIVNCLNCLCVCFHPTHLEKKMQQVKWMTLVIWLQIYKRQVLKKKNVIKLYSLGGELPSKQVNGRMNKFGNLPCEPGWSLLLCLADKYIYIK